MSIAPDLSDFSKEEIKTSLAQIRHPVDIAVYSTENYYNLGSIIRMSHNFLVRRIYAIDTPYYKRAAMGTHKWEDIRKRSLSDFVTEMEGRNVVAFEKRQGLVTDDLRAFSWPDLPVIVLGSEKTGIPDDILKIARNVVSVPMFGVHNDQNVATVAGIAVYDFITKHTMERK